MNFLTFHSVGNFIIPTDELIFFRGVGIPPASNGHSMQTWCFFLCWYWFTPTSKPHQPALENQPAGPQGDVTAMMLGIIGSVVLFKLLYQVGGLWYFSHTSYFYLLVSVYLYIYIYIYMATDLYLQVQCFGRWTCINSSYFDRQNSPSHHWDPRIPLVWILIHHH